MKFQGSGESRLGGSEKRSFICRFQNGNTNLFENTSEESWFLIFEIMLPKHVHMGQKFQRTLQSSMSFRLKHFFISITLSTQVASAPLRKYQHIHTKCVQNRYTFLHKIFYKQIVSTHSYLTV